jgi:class 3 adenylate cyclase
LITLVFSVALLPIAMLSIPGGGTILVFGVFIMLINFVITINHLWRTVVNLVCVFLMVGFIVYCKSNELAYMVVRILECVGISVPAFAFATFHYNTKVKEFTNTKLLHQERERNEALLLNILPIQTVRELKENGAATPHSHDMATVLFTDFEKFSQQTAALEPKLLITLLNDYFIAFDAICKTHNLEKIKTIGDAYMAVSGVPISNENHALNACNAALEMQTFVSEYKRKALIANNLYFEMRVGIHSGPLVSGVVGSDKFSFDIWGNAVNIAARMEAKGEIEKVNISANTYALIKDYFECESRGKKEIKHLGEIEMYFLTVSKR